MKLINLKLTNFEGVKSLEVNADGKSLSVYGDNGTGKTTIADAQAWLLFDKDSSFTAGFSPKMRDGNGEEIHNIDCTVCGTYEIGGVNVTLEKNLSEDWKKKRGSTETVFSGHKISYKIDGVPQKDREYNDYLNTIAEPIKLMILSNVSYFSEVLDIKKRREMLMSMTGDVSDFDVIGSDDELKPLLHLMLKPGTTQVWYSVSEFLQICKANVKAANDKLKELPGRIDEVSRQLENVPEKSEENIRTEISVLGAKRTSLELSLNQSGSEMVTSLRTDISKKQLEISQANAEYSTNCRKANDRIFEKINALNKQKSEISALVNDTNQQILELIVSLQKMKKMRDDTLNEYADVQALTWNGDTICPTCKQNIPLEQIEQAKADFNLKKSNELERLNNHGKSHCSRQMISELESKIAETKKACEKHKSAFDEITKDIENANAEIIISKTFEDTEEYRNMSQQIEDMQAQIFALENSDSGKKSEIKSQISQISGEINELHILLSQHENCKKAKQRIDELTAQEKDYADAYAKAQQGVNLCEIFSRTKVDLLTGKINSSFENVRFRLFKTQINGGIQDDCEVMALTTNGYIPYSTANNAAKISAGLEIIRGFSKHFGVEMPVFVDNAESITKLDGNGMQVIRLVVSEDDKTLRFESEDI